MPRFGMRAASEATNCDALTPGGVCRTRARNRVPVGRPSSRTGLHPSIAANLHRGGGRVYSFRSPDHSSVPGEDLGELDR